MNPTFMLRARFGIKPLRVLFTIFVASLFLLLLSSQSVHAAAPNLPPQATEALHLIYAGQPEQAASVLHALEAADPDNPIGFLLEADARWWEIFCESCEIKWNMIDAWHRPRLPSDAADLALIDKTIALAEAHIAKSDSAELQLYDGLAWGFRARLV